MIINKQEYSVGAYELPVASSVDLGINGVGETPVKLNVRA